MTKIKPFLLGGWLGFSLCVCGLRWHDWEFYLVLIPTVVITFWREVDHE